MQSVAIRMPIRAAENGLAAKDFGSVIGDVLARITKRLEGSQTFAPAARAFLWLLAVRGLFLILLAYSLRRVNELQNSECRLPMYKETYLIKSRTAHYALTTRKLAVINLFC